MEDIPEWMDTVFETICEEARRRPGKRYVPKLYQVKLEVDKKIGELICELMEVERGIERKPSLQKGDDDDTGIE